MSMYYIYLFLFLTGNENVNMKQLLSYLDSSLEKHGNYLLHCNSVMDVEYTWIL